METPLKTMAWTETQIRRLKELDAESTDFSANTPSLAEKNKLFQQIEKRLVKKKQAELREFLTVGLRPRLNKLTETLIRVLNQHHFAQVTTPTIISKAALAKMTIDDAHPLSQQVYWLNDKQCLRPMLAPNLYSLMVDFGRLKDRPIRFFEIGSCFRKESDGALHNSEFTMLNLVEMGLPEEDRQERLKELGSIVAEAAGLKDYRFETEESTVYGNTVDIVSGKESVEVASGAMGPHPLDAPWRITDTWVGLGFGLERLLMMAQESENIGKWGKSLAYVDGIRLNI